MLKGRPVLVFSALIWCSLSVWAQESIPEESIDSRLSAKPTVEAEPLFSPSVGERFYEIAYELANAENVTASQADQAIVFLIAAKDVGGTGDQIYPLLIKLACEYSQRDYSQRVYRWLEEYVSESTARLRGDKPASAEAGGGLGPVQGFAVVDLAVVRKAITYLLDRLNSREERQRLLQEMLASLGGKNAAFDSELATLLGLLMVEKADFEAAQSHFVRAYLNNKYNRLAFAKLAELVPEQVGPAMYLEHVRLVLRENPVDIEAALAFAQYSERLQLYDMAADAYQYCADLFGYLYPGEALPRRIYLPWIISCYNTKQNQHRCLQIANLVRKSGRFDILLEAIAGKAAQKIGDAEEAIRILQTAEQKAQQLLDRGPKLREGVLATPADSYPQQIGAMQFAWFYCFASPDKGKALDWANKAYSTEPNSPASAALLAYALVLNEQLEWAKPLIEGYEHTQIADLVQAQIQLAEGQRDSAIETLRAAIAKDPGSLAAERAKEILARLGGEYIPLISSDVILAVLRNSFGQQVVPGFISPDKIISVQFSIRGNEFPYGSAFGGTIAIVNNSSEAFIISENGLSEGNIRIDAQISGDLNKKVPKLISHKINSGILVQPGKSISASVQLVTGELRRTLLSYPQASLDVEFTLYLDPVTTDRGEIANRLVDMKPVKVVVKRPGIDLSSKYLRNRFNSISTGQASQKIKIAELFVGLLKEQYAMAEHGTLYRFKYADWMPTLLKSALLHESGLLLSPAEPDWAIRVHTMVEMLSLPLDHELINAAAKNLNDPKWPVRMMAVYLLAKSADSEFGRVLDWTAQYDSSRLVRDMASALSPPQSAFSGQAAEPVRLGVPQSSEWREIRSPRETQG